MSDKEAEILEEDDTVVEAELDEKCSCEEGDGKDCDCDKKKDYDEDDEAELEEALEETVDEMKKSHDEDEMEDENAISEEIDFETIAESLGLDSSDAVTALKEKIETVIAFNTNEAVEAETKKLKTESAEALKTIKEEMETDMLEKVNAYATMIVNEWLEENAIEITNQIETDRNRRIVESMKTLMEENSVELDEETTEIVTELQSEMEELQTENETLEETNSKYRSLLEAVAKEKEIEKYDLSEAQKEKVAKIASDIPVNENMPERIQAIAELVQESKPKKATTEPVKELSESLEDSFVEPEKIVNENNKSETFDDYLNSLIST